MKVLAVSSEMVAFALEALVRPDVEVVCVGQEIDSKEIDQAIFLCSPGSHSMLTQVADKLKGKMKEGSQLTIIVI